MTVSVMTEPAQDAISTGETPAAIDWPLIGRVAIKAAVLFLLLNVGFAAIRPLDALGRLSLYNVAYPGRLRLPYGEIPAEDYNLTLNNLPAMFAAHAIARPPAADEFRVLLIGDSATWGWFLANDDTLAGQLNALDLRAADGRRVVVHNLGYPVMSLTKDLLLLDEALAQTEADLILWPVTLQSFARGRQLEHPLLHENAGRVRDLIGRYDLSLDPADSRFVDRGFTQETLVGRRRDLADLLRLQAWGMAWAATGRDQAIPAEIPARTDDLKADESWLDVAEERPLTEDDLAFEVLRAGLARAADVPVILINEPMFIANGVNANGVNANGVNANGVNANGVNGDIRYNTFYPRWAYDQYRQMLAGAAAAEGWRYLDFWDAIPPEEFTDTPVHLTPEGSRQFAALLANAFVGSE